ncbi:MAG: enoyl-CoA hydratase-related protein [Thermodesulfobacteriota bacterium]
MVYQALTVDVIENGIGQIALNRPKQLNVFNTTMATELAQALTEMDADPQVRVIVLKGTGKVFSAGIDVTEFWNKTASQYKEWVELMEKSVQTMMSMAKPVIAQVHGVAAANGAGVVAASDLAVCAEDARIGFTAINVGLFCLGPAVPLSRVVGRKQALELLLFGDLVPASRAMEIGLVNKVVPAEDLETETLAYARKLAAKSPQALQLGKKTFHVTMDMELSKAFEYMNEAFARLCTSQDAHEGVTAFLEKREPQWKGE